MQQKIDSILVTGYAKAPQGTAMFERYKYSGIVLEIDKKTNVIVDAEFTFVTDLAKQYFRKLFIGYNLDRGIDDLINHIEMNYFAPSVNSITIALKSAYQRYLEKKG